MRVVIATPARQELANAIEFYTAEAPGLAEDFVQEFEAGLHQLARLPHSGAPYHHGTRRLLLRRFPFSVIYRVEPDRIGVVAIAHQRRRPDYWAESR